jgi:gamma-glutamylcyclotransferase (GGCT)/AIG2-like uncharacterized protein YtfP
VSACVLQGTLHDLVSYPALAPGTGRVVGELCALGGGDALAVLDAWEDYDPADEGASEYVRRRVRLLEPDVEAWTYMFNRPHVELPVIDDGDWVAHLARRGVAPDAARWGAVGPSTGGGPRAST